MKGISLPGARAALVDQAGLAQPYFYRWLQATDENLKGSTDAGDNNDQAIKTIALRLGSPDGSVALIPAQGNAAVINGGGSISVDGTLEAGVVNITLQYDTQFPGATTYYGADSTGKRGWFPVSDALLGSGTITLNVDPETGITLFSLAELADAGGGSLVKVARDAYGRIVGTSAATTDDLAEGSGHLYFTKTRVSTSLRQGLGIDLEVDASGNTTIGLTVEDGGVLLIDWAGNQLTDWTDVDLEDWTPAAVDVNSVFGRFGNVVAVAGDYTTDLVPEPATPTNLWFTATRVRNVVLTGLSLITNAAITSADSLLMALGKLQAQITARQIIGQPVAAPIYTLATLPAAASVYSSASTASVYCSDLVEGLGPVWSDGTNWRRFTDSTVAN